MLRQLHDGRPTGGCSIVARVVPFAEAVRPNPPAPRPLFLCRAPCGFPSPAREHIEAEITLDEIAVRNPQATYFVRVEGESMLRAGIHDGDVLVVDRSIEVQDGHVVIAALDGDMTVKRVRKRGQALVLEADNEAYAPIEVHENAELVIWGVVTHALHRVG